MVRRQTRAQKRNRRQQNKSRRNNRRQNKSLRRKRQSRRKLRGGRMCNTPCYRHRMAPDHPYDFPGGQCDPAPGQFCDFL